MSVSSAHFVFYVQQQAESTAFYSAVLGQAPRLEAPGMTEFDLPGACVLGLMPVTGIDALLGHAIEGLAQQTRVPRAELYLRVDDPHAYQQRALAAGARELSPVLLRDWHDLAGYCEDPDGHVIAFAKEA